MVTHPISNVSEVESGVADSVVLSLSVSAPISLIIESVNRIFYKIEVFRHKNFGSNSCIDSRYRDQYQSFTHI